MSAIRTFNVEAGLPTLDEAHRPGPERHKCRRHHRLVEVTPEVG
jgi:hypothetical protein